ncbi:SpoIIE family protein phosphatase [Streptomyces sp. NPDC002758]
MTPRTERTDFDGWCLPLCTSSTISLANLDAQTTGLAQHYAQSGRTDVGARLTNGLLARHSITAHPRDLTAADRITAELVGRTPADPIVWITRAHVTTTTHRFAETMQALALATHHGAATEAVTEEHADVLEACGRRPAALRLRLAHGTTEPQQIARIACLHVSMGNDEQARDAFGEALRDTALVMVTDGVVEGPDLALDAGLEQAGTLAAQALRDGLSAEKTADRLLDAALAMNHHDDLAVLIVRVT